MPVRCCRLAISGTTPPKRRCTSWRGSPATPSRARPAFRSRPRPTSRRRRSRCRARARGELSFARPARDLHDPRSRTQIMTRARCIGEHHVDGAERHPHTLDPRLFDGRCSSWTLSRAPAAGARACDGARRRLQQADEIPPAAGNPSRAPTGSTGAIAAASDDSSTDTGTQVAKRSSPLTTSQSAQEESRATAARVTSASVTDPGFTDAVRSAAPRSGAGCRWSSSLPGRSTSCE